MKNLDYPYRQKAWATAFACLFFGAITFLMVREAMTNERGLVLNGIVHFSTHGATIFYWCVAVASGLFVAVGIPTLFVSLFSSHRLVVTDATVFAPRFGFSRQPTIVPLSSITGLDIQVAQRQRMLNIRHKTGKLTIMRSRLPNAAALDELLAALLAAVKVPVGG